MRKKTKFLLLRTSIMVLFAVLAGRLWYIQVVMGSYFKGQADTTKIRLEPVSALRGIVYDRNGHQLVFNQASWNVTIVPHGVPTTLSTRIFAELSKLLGNDPSPQKIARIVQDNEWQSYAPALIKRSISADTAMIIMQLHSRLPGVRAEPSSVRQYVQDPQFSLAHIFGYTGKISAEQYQTDKLLYPRERVGANDIVGRDGLELSMDAYLHGVNATDQVEVDAGERPVRVLSHGRAVPGNNVYLTIDANLQSRVAGDLQAALNKLGVREGIAVVEDVHTGEILSMVSLPSFNNNWFSGSISNRRYEALLNDPSHPLTNLATQGVFPPGSTYKIITAAAGLQTGVTNASRIINDTGAISLCSRYIPNSCQVFNGWKPGGLGPMNLESALAESSDIYFYTVAGGNPNIDPTMPRIGADRLGYYARLFGLGAPTRIDLPGEASGFVPSATWFNRLTPDHIRKNPGDSWHIGDTYNMSIGQGFNDATPLQMVNVAAAVANNGVLYRPQIVHHVTGRVRPKLGPTRVDHLIQPFAPQIIRRDFIDPGNLALIQSGMHDGVAWPGFIGTSYAVRDARIDAAGKTGTAEVRGRPPHAWWVGYAPFTNPRVAVCVMIPNANSEGATASAPIAHKILEDYFHLKARANWLSDVQQFLVPQGRAG